MYSKEETQKIKERVLGHIRRKISRKWWYYMTPKSKTSLLNVDKKAQVLIDIEHRNNETKCLF
jgi:hypothetical protein